MKNTSTKHSTRSLSNINDYGPRSDNHVRKDLDNFISYTYPKSAVRR